MTDLGYSELEEELRTGVRSMLAARSPQAKVLGRVESDQPYDLGLWRTLAVDMGLAGLAVPAEHGGAGASFREAAVVCEELGRSVAPVPYLGSAVVATAVLLAVEPRLLPAIAGGERIAALAVPFPTAPAWVPSGAVTVTGGSLSGAVAAVADALPADLLLVPAGDELYAVEATEVRRTPVVSLDATRTLCDLRFEGAAGRLVAKGAPATAAVRAGLTAGAALLASEQLGLAEWCLESTVEYVGTRVQFARPVGSFQAVKHRLADVWAEVAQCRAVARYAAGCLAGSSGASGRPGSSRTAGSGADELAVAAALAQAHCGPVAVRAAEECVQLHGGVGFTWEHPAHLYLKRAKADAIGFGTADEHRLALAALVDLPAP